MKLLFAIYLLRAHTIGCNCGDLRICIRLWGSICRRETFARKDALPMPSFVSRTRNRLAKPRHAEVRNNGDSREGRELIKLPGVTY